MAAFRSKARGSSPEVSLVLHPCSSFTVQHVDTEGVPLGKDVQKLGAEASKRFPERCRALARFESGGSS